MLEHTIPENSFDKVYLALKYLVEASEERQKDFHFDILSLQCDISNKQFFKEFCTVRLCSARSSGHSSAIYKLIQNKFEKVVLIYSNISIKNHSESIIREYNIENKICSVILNNGKFFPISKEVEAIIVDGSWCLSKKDIEDIYILGERYFDKTKPFYFIFVQ